MKLGRNLARTFLDYYKLQNLIVFNPSTAITPKLNSQFLNMKISGSNSNQQTSGTSSSLLNANNMSGLLNSPSNGNGGSNGNLNGSNSFSNATSLLNGNAKTIRRPERSNGHLTQTLKPLSSMSLNANSNSSISASANGGELSSQQSTGTSQGSRHAAKFYIENGLE